MSSPRPKVIPAARRPRRICRPPDLQREELAVRLTPAPIPNKPNTLSMRLITTAVNPLVKMNGKTGIIAPMANRKKEVIAAPQAEPPRSFGSMPNSSRASVSRAVLLCCIKFAASSLAVFSSRPFD